MGRKRIKEEKVGRVTSILFPIVFFLGTIGILCFWAEHFISLNSDSWSTYYFFGIIVGRSVVIDTLLAVGIVSFVVSFCLMLYYFVYISKRGY